MSRDVEERKKRAALRKLRRAAALAGKGLGPPLSDWERAFLAEVEERVEKYGSAFADPMKGQQGEALSGLQQAKLREIDKKAMGKGPKPLQGKQPAGSKRRLVRQDRRDPDAPLQAALPKPPPALSKPSLVAASSLPQPEEGNVTRLRRPRPKLTVIEGGGKKTET